MTKQIATFQLGDTLLGVNILLVKEIYRQMGFSDIPNAPDHLIGLMNLRGRVVTVIDLNVCLNRPRSENIENGRLLIFKTQEEILGYMGSGLLDYLYLGEDIFGFLIDRMDDVVTVEDEEILPPPPNITDIEEDLIKGVIKQGDRLVILIDVPAVLERVMAGSVESAEDGKTGQH